MIWITNKVIVNIYLAESNMQDLRSKCFKVKSYWCKPNTQALVSQVKVLSFCMHIFL